jgi:glutathione S-transferase
MLEQRVRARLDELAAHLGSSDWLDGEFSVADLMMVTVLRRAGRSGIFDDYPSLAAYIARGEARPAYQRAFAAQLAVFEAASQAGRGV